MSYFSPGSRGAPGHIGLRNALRELGYVEGRDIRYEDESREGPGPRDAAIAPGLADHIIE